MQQQAANKATQSALGAGTKWAAWGKKKGAPSAATAATAGVKRTAAGASKAPGAGETSNPGTPPSVPGGDRALASTPAPGGRAAAGGQTPGATPAGWGNHEGPTVLLKDVVAALDRDPAYAKSTLMYQLLEAADFY